MQTSEQALLIVLDWEWAQYSSFYDAAEVDYSGDAEAVLQAQKGHAHLALLACLAGKATPALLFSRIACVSTGLRAKADDLVPPHSRIAAGRKLRIALDTQNEWKKHTFRKWTGHVWGGWILHRQHLMEAPLPLPYFDTDFFGGGFDLESEIISRLHFDEARWWAGRRGADPSIWAFTLEERKRFSGLPIRSAAPRPPTPPLPPPSSIAVTSFVVKKVALLPISVFAYGLIFWAGERLADAAAWLMSP